MVIQKGGDYGLLAKMGCCPDTNLHPEDLPKSVCIKMEVRKFEGLPPFDLKPIEKSIGRWDYDHLMWVSEFVPRTSPHSHLLIAQLLKCDIP